MPCAWRPQQLPRSRSVLPDRHGPTRVLSPTRHDRRPPSSLRVIRPTGLPEPDTDRPHEHGRDTRPARRRGERFHRTRPDRWLARAVRRARSALRSQTPRTFAGDRHPSQRPMRSRVFGVPRESRRSPLAWSLSTAGLVWCDVAPPFAAPRRPSPRSSRSRPHPPKRSRHSGSKLRAAVAGARPPGGAAPRSSRIRSSSDRSRATRDEFAREVNLTSLHPISINRSRTTGRSESSSSTTRTFMRPRAGSCAVPSRCLHLARQPPTHPISIVAMCRLRSPRRTSEVCCHATTGLES